MTNHQLQTVLDALEIAEKHLAYVEITEAIAIVKQMMQAEPVLEVVRMPDHWDGRYFRDDGGSYISESAISKLPIGTKLYTHPAPQAVPAWWPISSAPKDGTVILGYCVHTADPYFAGERLTDYGARCEGLGHVEDGIHAILWESAREESDGWESPSYWIPAGWVHNADCEQMANPTHWMPLPSPQKVGV
jgi:hypothetical protein